MKILTVSQYFPPDSCFGAENYAFNLSVEYVKQGHEVQVFTSRKLNSTQNSFTDSITYKGLQINRLTNFKKVHPYKSLQVAKAFTRLIKEFKPDLIHFHHLAGLSSELPKIANKHNVAVFFTLHDFWNLCSNFHFLKDDNQICQMHWGAHCANCDHHTNNLLKKNAVRKNTHYSPQDIEGFYLKRQQDLVSLLSLAEKIYCPSHFLMKAYLKAGVPTEKLIHSPNGMLYKKQLVNKGSVPQKNIKFIFIGSISQHKGLHILVNAFSQLLNKNCSLTIFGKPGVNEQKYWEAILTKLPENCSYKGYIEPQEIINTLKDYDSLIIPSIWFENAPLVINEAYIAGIPVICSNIGGMAEMVHDQKTGFHFKVGDVNSLVNKINALVESPESVIMNLPKIKHIYADADEKLNDYKSVIQGITS